MCFDCVLCQSVPKKWHSGYEEGMVLIWMRSWDGGRAYVVNFHYGGDGDLRLRICCCSTLRKNWENRVISKWQLVGKSKL